MTNGEIEVKIHLHFGPFIVGTSAFVLRYSLVIGYLINRHSHRWVLGSYGCCAISNPPA